MKKQLLYSFAAMVGLALTGCNGDYDDWANPQSYEQEAAKAAYGVTASAGGDANIVMPVADDEVRLVSVTAGSEEVVGYTVRKLLVNGTEVSGKFNGSDLVVSASELNNLVQQAAFSRAHKTYSLTVDLGFGANLANGDAVACNAQTTASITTATTPAADENGYYVLGDFVGQDWTLSAPIWMTDNEDGTYTATVTTKAEGSNWFKFYQGSYQDDADWDIANQGQMGCAVNGDASLAGFVVWQGDAEHPDGVQTPTISGKGTFEVTLDINNYTYTVKRAEARYYVVGVPTNWSQTDMSCMFYAHGDNIYSYTTSWSGAWDLQIWDHKGFGDWALTFGGINGDGSATGTLIPGGEGGAFQSPSAGYYTLTINMNDNSYAWTAVTPVAEYTSVSLIGDFNGWANEGVIELAELANAPHNWYVRATIPADGGLKFRADHDWAVSWGTDDPTAIGDVYYLEPGTGNITVPAGTYDFYLNDISGRWSVVKVEE